MKLSNSLLAAVALLVCELTLSAKVQLPDIISDNMVLQRNAEVGLWGKAAPGRKITVTASWDGKKTVCKSGDDGLWSLRVQTPDAGGPYSICFDDGEKTVVDNVLIGEVWFCSGQSNMEMPMEGFNGQPVEHSADYILSAKKDRPIRMCNVKMTASLEPLDNCNCDWSEHTPDGVRRTSATAYFFALRLQETLGVPVGIIHSSWGGTPIQAWMEKSLIESEFSGEFDLSPYQTGISKRMQHVPGTLYNAMIHPFEQYTVKGFIWYQGCSNRNNPEQYKRLQPAFVKMLRQKWGNDNLPFYFTQIAPYEYAADYKYQAGFMMWAQAQTLDLIPMSGMAATHDIGEMKTIHPKKKKEVGDRLAFLALSNNYGFNVIDAKAPIARSFRTEENKIIVTFDVGPKGLNPIGTRLESFEIAGEDMVFHPARAVVCKNRNEVEVSSSEVPAPKAVRYGMHNWSKASLFNTSGIPASPFRSDNWSE